MKKSKYQLLILRGKNIVKEFYRNTKFMLEEKAKNENKQEYLYYKQQSEKNAIEIDTICSIATLLFEVSYDDFRNKIEP